MVGATDSGSPIIRQYCWQVEGCPYSGGNTLFNDPVGGADMALERCDQVGSDVFGGIVEQASHQGLARQFRILSRHEFRNQDTVLCHRQRVVTGGLAVPACYPR